MSISLGMPRNTLCLAIALATASAMTAVSSAALADSMALEEVVVTAQKREESIQQTPISLAAFSAADLENKGINGLVDLRSEVPNLQLTPHPNSSTTTRVFMRGVGNNDDQITQDPSVAVYLDGVYVARSQGLAMDVADIERVEVLRGPQGSLYGRNATGGAINFITRAPELGQFGFQQSLTVGNDSLLRARTQANLPLGDTAALQLSYLKVQKDGFVKNAGTGVDRFGDQDRNAYRAALHWQPTDAIDVRYSFDYSQIDDTPAYITAVPYFPQQGKRASQSSAAVRNLQRNDVTAQGHNLSVSWDLDDSLTLKSITGYRKLANYTYQDYNSGVIGPFPVYVTSFDSDQWQFSQEFQAVGDALDSRLEYVAGIYYFDEKGDSYDTTDTPNLGPARPATHGDRWVSIHNSAYAAFGQATYTPALLDDKLHVTVGLRRSQDERGADLYSVTTLIASGTAIPSARGDGSRKFNNLSPSLIVAYDIDADMNVYAKAVKGYKTGGYNVRASSIERFEDGFDEENLISYELGLKSQWWDNRVRFNTALFLAKYDDIQLNVQSDPGNIAVTDVLNAGKATISGAEIELSARLTEGLTAGLNYAYLDAHYDEVKIAGTAGNAANQFIFPEAPHNSYAVNLSYEFPATPIGIVTAAVDYSWQDQKYSSSNDRRYITNDYGLLNARLSLTDIDVGVGTLRTSLWGRNLEEKQYYASMFNAGVPSAIFGEPRSYGIDVTYQY